MAAVGGYVGSLDRLLAAPPGRFVDNGDGTVTDNQTGRQWEKKGFSFNGVGESYTWSGSGGGTAPDGSLFTGFLTSLNDTNAGCFAGHCDWRIPTIAELETIALATSAGPRFPATDASIRRSGAHS